MAYVVRTWLDSMAERYASRRRRALRESWRPRVLEQLATFGAIIACSPEHLGTIHGWACGGPGELRFVYVPFKLRGHGLGGVLANVSTRLVGEQRAA